MGLRPVQKVAGDRYVPLGGSGRSGHSALLDPLPSPSRGFDHARHGSMRGRTVTLMGPNGLAKALLRTAVDFAKENNN